MHLIIGNKLYSSWSLRPWLLMKALGMPFKETVIPLSQPDTKKNILEHSPSGKVPLLIDGTIRVWESLAIMEYLAEKFPSAGVWPKDAGGTGACAGGVERDARRLSGVAPGVPDEPRPHSSSRSAAWPPDVVDAVERIETLWAEARKQFGEWRAISLWRVLGGRRDVAPVVTRLDTYQIPVSSPRRGVYMDAILQHPAFVDWRLDALKEPWFLRALRAGHEIASSYINPKS